jgi:hypothetical protein
MESGLERVLDQDLWKRGCKKYGKTEEVPALVRFLSLIFIFIFVDTFVVVSVVVINLINIFVWTSQSSKAIALFALVNSSMVRVHTIPFLFVCTVGSRPVVEPGVESQIFLTQAHLSL